LTRGTARSEYEWESVLYDRHAKRVTAGLEPANTVGRGLDEPDRMADAVGIRARCEARSSRSASRR